MRSLKIIGLAMAFFLSVVTPCPAASLSDLGWLAGTWVGSLGRGSMEEIWTAGDETSMVGTFRAHKAGRILFYEFMTIDKISGPIVLRLRHFDGDLTAHEDKADTYKFELVGLSRTRALFENKATKPPERLTYSRIGSSLVIRLDAVRDGRVQSSTFRFQHR